MKLAICILVLAATAQGVPPERRLLLLFRAPQTCADAERIIGAEPLRLRCAKLDKSSHAYSAEIFGKAPTGELIRRLRRSAEIRAIQVEAETPYRGIPKGTAAR